MRIVTLLTSWVILTSASSLVAAGKIQERAWLGGEFKLAKAGRSFAASADSIGTFPAELQPALRRGLLVCELATNTPAALAGLRAGDLIVELEGKPVRSLRTFVAQLNKRRPGEKLSLRIYRDGTLFEHKVTLGCETFQQKRSLTVGLLLSGKVDLLPNPDFSLVAAGFHRRFERMELRSPEAEFLLRNRDVKLDEAGLAREGWQAWVLLVSFGSHKRILSQEALPAAGQRFEDVGRQ